MRNLQSSGHFTGAFPPLSAPAWLCPTLNQAPWSSPRAWSEYFQDKSTTSSPRESGVSQRDGAFLLQFWWEFIQEPSAEPGNSCCLPCQDGFIFRRCFAPQTVVQNQRMREKELNSEQKNLLRTKRRRGQSSAVGGGHRGVLRVKSKAGPMANSMGAVLRPQSTQKSRISAKNVLISFGIYNSFLWPDRGSCPDGIPWKHSRDTHEYLMYINIYYNVKI